MWPHRRAEGAMSSSCMHICGSVDPNLLAGPHQRTLFGLVGVYFNIIIFPVFRSLLKPRPICQPRPLLFLFIAPYLPSVNATPTASSRASHHSTPTDKHRHTAAVHIVQPAQRTTSYNKYLHKKKQQRGTEWPTADHLHPRAAKPQQT